MICIDNLKDIGAIALFLGVFLNAYHYYISHKWTRREKKFDIVLDLIKDLDSIRNEIIEIENQCNHLTHQISPYSHNLEEKPSSELCYELYLKK
jgi:hypothetical protein